MIVLIVLALGGLAAARFSARRYGYLLAAAAGTGALWSVWALAEVDVVEPYVLPRRSARPSLA